MEQDVSDRILYVRAKPRLGWANSVTHLLHQKSQKKFGAKLLR